MDQQIEQNNRKVRTTMPRLHAIAPETTTGHVKALLDGVQTKFGMVPNMMRTMASCPTVLEGYLQFAGAVGHGQLSSRVREQVALTVSEFNGCDYCLAAHSAVGKMLGLTSDQIRDSRLGTAIDSKTDTLLRFAHKVLETHGKLDGSDLQEVRDAGFDDAAIAEVVANVALSVFTNFFNNVSETEVDFPKAPALQSEAAAV